MKLNSHIALYILFSLLFTSCTESPVPVTSTITIPSETPQPTQASTETPTLTPTATENPFAGAPDGTTGKNTNGEWVKTVENVTYVYKTVTNPKRYEVLTQGWFKDVIVNPTYQGGIPLINEKGYPTAMALHIWCEEGLQCPTLQHPESGNTVIPDPSFTRALLAIIETRVIGKQPWKIRSDESAAFLNDLGSDEVSISFNVNGVPYEYGIRPESSINVYINKTEISNPDFSVQSYLQASISGDVQGNVNVVEYLSTPLESLSHSEILDGYLRYAFMIFCTDDMSQDSVLNNIYSPVLSFIDISENGPNPYFIITP